MYVCLVLSVWWVVCTHFAGVCRLRVVVLVVLLWVAKGMVCVCWLVETCDCVGFGRLECLFVVYGFVWWFTACCLTGWVSNCSMSRLLLGFAFGFRD